MTDSPVDPGDVMLNHYLIATWAKVCQALGPEFEVGQPHAALGSLLERIKKSVISFGQYEFSNIAHSLNIISGSFCE